MLRITWVAEGMEGLAEVNWVDLGEADWVDLEVAD